MPDHLLRAAFYILTALGMTFLFIWLGYEVYYHDGARRIFCFLCMFLFFLFAVYRVLGCE